MNIFKKSRAFTLIEILIVISIMAIFTAMIYSSFDKSRAKSRDQKRISDISNIQLSLEQYFNKNGVYPVNLEKLLEKPTPTSAAYLSEMPNDPLTNIPFGGLNSNSGYFPIKRSNLVDTNCVSYHLWTTFEQVNQYLDQKKSFDSTPTGLPSTFYACGTTGKPTNSKLPGSLVYDVTP